MSLRQKLLLVFSLIVAASVAIVAWTVLLRIRQIFEQQDQEKTQLLVTQFQREFQHRSSEVASAVDHLAASEHLRRIAEELAQSSDASPYLTEAQSLAAEAQIDYLEILGPDGNIVSSAQWPARFGYPEPAVTTVGSHAQTFLKREEQPDNTSALGVFALRPVPTSGQGTQPPTRLLGGKRLDQQFLADLPTSTSVQAYLYDSSQNPDSNQSNASQSSGSPSGATPSFDSKRLLGISGEVPNASRYRPLVETAQRTGQPATSILYLTPRREDSVQATVLPLNDEAGHVMAMLIVVASRRAMVEAQQHIRSIAYSVAAAGILLAVTVSIWIAARISHPIEELARAAEEVALGNWDTHVQACGRDEIATLARSFNHMTAELTAQRERLLQSERVAAWRELARRLAHELKNPLFPLQITIENLVRSRQLSAAEFDEVFTESTTALTQELANLKTIIGRFSDFSRMPRPQLERLDARAALVRVLQLYGPKAVLTENSPEPKIEYKFELNIDLHQESLLIDADPEMLHRALSNLVLNAMDAMPEGGKLTLSAKALEDRIEIRVADTGQGMTREECGRLFTPYYTTKQHGTGLGLAIVQSVVADHNATITVESQPASGTAFVLLFPRASGSTGEAN